VHRFWLRVVTGIGGAVLALAGLLLAIAELGHALRGSRGAWLALAVVLAAAAGGAWLVWRAWRGAPAPAPRVAV
jgi:hypothetical protein